VRKIFLVAAIILVVTLAGGALYWYFVLYQKPSTEITPGTTAKPTPGVGFGSLRHYAAFCKEFQKVEGEISCEEAIQKTKQMYSGQIESVSKANKYNPTIVGTEGRKDLEVWRIVTILDQPIGKEGKLAKKVIIAIERKTGKAVLVYPVVNK
jgi:hypothetical protein